MRGKITLPENVRWSCQYCGARVYEADVLPLAGNTGPAQGGYLSTLHPCGHKSGLRGTQGQPTDKEPG